MRAAVKPVTPRKAAPPQPPAQGRQIHLRAPQSKAERRMVAQLKKAFKGRERASREFVMCNRAIAQLEVDLRKANMVQDPEAIELPKADAPEADAATTDEPMVKLPAEATP